MKSNKRQVIENWILDPTNRDTFETQLSLAIEKDDGWISYDSWDEEIEYDKMYLCVIKSNEGDDIKWSVINTLIYSTMGWQIPHQSGFPDVLTAGEVTHYKELPKPPLK